MGFEFGTWLVTFAFNRSGNKSLDWAAKSALSSSLTSEISDWAKELPPGIELVPKVMFPDVDTPETEEKRPALAKLSVDLKEKRIPTEATWLAALTEQWITVRQGMPRANLQTFFQLAPEEARQHLEPLSVALARRCAQDDQLFKGTVIEELRSGKLSTGSEPAIAAGLITILEDRGVLYQALQNEAPLGCYESAKMVRSTLTEIMSRLPRDSKLFDFCDRLRKPCATMMRAIEKQKLQRNDNFFEVEDERSRAFFDALRQFRLECASSIRTICDEYAIAPNDSLKSLFSPA